MPSSAPLGREVTAARDPEPRAPLLRSLGVLVLALVSLLVPKLALVAGLLTFLNFVAVPARAFRRKACLWLSAAAGVLSALAIMRFLITEAMPGLVRGGLNAAELRAVSRLREIRFAEEALRRHALHDPDHDGVGSAVLLTELSGLTPLAGGQRLELLNEQYHAVQGTREGPAALIAGYLFMVCVPTREGALSARPGAEFDEQAAERRFVAYAWPADDAQGVATVYYIDQQDRILQFDNREGSGLRYAGPNFPPPCDAAQLPDARQRWTAWRDKKPNTEPPGEPAR